MKKSIILMISATFISCSENKIDSTSDFSIIQKIITEDYEFYKTRNEQNTLLILFPDISGNAQSTRRSFNILNIAKENNISVLLMNFNNHLFLSKKDKVHLTEILDNIIKHHNLSPNKIVLGGFSSGGIVSTLWSNYLLETAYSHQPEKVFAVDSPLDLVTLFNSVTDVDSTSHEISMAEAEYITNYFENALHTKDSLIQKIAKVSPFDYSTHNFYNIRELKGVDFRIYTEPDSIWWKENRGFEFEETDSYQLIRFVEVSKEKGWENIQLILTTDRGFRSNGQRHPHSWSIVDESELVKWILKD